MDSDSGSQPAWLLADLVTRTPGTRWAVLLSSDGLPTARHGCGADQADTLAAIASGLLSTGTAADRLIGGSGSVHQAALQLSGGLLLVTSAGERSVLAVVASADANLEIVGEAMQHLVNAVAPFLGTPARASGQP